MACRIMYGQTMMANCVEQQLESLVYAFAWRNNANVTFNLFFMPVGALGAMQVARFIWPVCLLSLLETELEYVESSSPS